MSRMQETTTGALPASNAEPPDSGPIAALRVQFDGQRAAFDARPMPSADERIAWLDALASMLRRHEQGFVDAVSADFGYRAPMETRLLELMPILEEIAYLRRRLRRWMRPHRVAVNWMFLPGRAELRPQPLGVVGVIGAWNYPLLLVLSPLSNALAAGNRVMLKPSERAPATAELLQRLLAEAFPDGEAVVATGDEQLSAGFAALPFDHLVFTGSTRVGRAVMRTAADNLTPVTLELGGKSPAWIHPDFDLADAADRICSAKFWNSGQTCVAPDYVLVDEARMDAFAHEARRAVERRWPRAARNPDYSHMLDAASCDRMQSLVQDAAANGAHVIALGDAGPGNTYPPTLVLGATRGMRAMREEIFGPLLPVIGYRTQEEALAFVRAGERPLAFYYFDHNRDRIDHVLDHTHAGGVTLNDAIFHMVQHRLPFGGIGASGMGGYHGDAGFRALSHFKPVLRQNRLAARILAFMTKPPYGRRQVRLLRWLAGLRGE